MFGDEDEAVEKHFLETGEEGREQKRQCFTNIEKVSGISEEAED